ncbi:MAG: SDR family oxidoreductase [Planctomycetes bacterium]|jgi:NAD(P)-dependent dehydrogenase (short-subunit alcohol dehydrogenase family)|nr:SDR family oxidoreductase [Planctomycetota bacterium]
MSIRLENRRCLIVGGTSGIGLAAARRFLDEGARVVVAGLTAPPLDDGLNFLACDVTSETQVENIFAEAITNLGGLDVLFHVAGSSGRKHGDGPLHECTDLGWQGTLDANLKGVFLTNRAAVRHFLKQETGGAILNMSSVLAFSPAPRHFDTVAYAASKGGIIALSRQAAARYAADRIRINVLAPGLIDTPMAARAIGDPAIRAFLESKQPLGPGPGTPEDCADAAVFLCSDAARFITGVVLPIDGGWSVCEGRGANP